MRITSSCCASCGSTSLLKPPHFTKFRCDTLYVQVTGKCRGNLAWYGRCKFCKKLLWVKTMCKSCIIAVYLHQQKIITFMINILWVSIHRGLLKEAQRAWNGILAGYGYGYYLKKDFPGWSTRVFTYFQKTQVNPLHHRDIIQLSSLLLFLTALPHQSPSSAFWEGQIDAASKGWNVILARSGWLGQVTQKTCITSTKKHFKCFMFQVQRDQLVVLLLQRQNTGTIIVLNMNSI